VYANLGAALVLHSVLVDGLQKMRHFKKAGESDFYLCAYGDCVSLSSPIRYLYNLMLCQ
jgi:hypothetical protein